MIEVFKRTKNSGLVILATDNIFMIRIFKWDIVWFKKNHNDLVII